MKAYQIQTQFFKVLGHPTRLAILDILRDGEQCVCHMEAVLRLRQAHISQHLMVLREAGLVADRRDGWNIFYHVVKPEIYRVIEAMNSYTGQPAGLPLKDKLLTSKHTCPCPKCHTSSPSTSAEKVQFLPDLIEVRR